MFIQKISYASGILLTLLILIPCNLLAMMFLLLRWQEVGINTLGPLRNQALHILEMGTPSLRVLFSSPHSLRRRPVCASSLVKSNLPCNGYSVLYPLLYFSLPLRPTEVLGACWLMLELSCCVWFR